MYLAVTRKVQAVSVMLTWCISTDEICGGNHVALCLEARIVATHCWWRRTSSAQSAHGRTAAGREVLLAGKLVLSCVARSEVQLRHVDPGRGR